MYFKPALMRNCIPFLFLVLLISCSQEKEERALSVIQGKIENLPASVSQVKLKRMGINGPEIIDSAEISSGQFSLEAPSDSEYLYRLEVGQAFLPLFMEQGEHQLKAEFNNLYSSATYTNSPLTSEMRKTEALRMSFEVQAQSLQNEYETAYYSGNIKGADSARVAFEILRKNSKQKIKTFIDSIGPGPVSYLSTSMLDPEEDFVYLDSLALRFDKEKPSRAYTQKLNRFLEMPRKLAIGRTAPEFSLPNPGGKSVSLSSFRGKWVLLDFWASWCKPCRAENPFLADLNSRFKPRGLQIFSVSLDGDRESWMKAMVQDQMNWAHASDLNGWKSSAGKLYGINSIPASFLINPEGKIASKNLRGQQLLEKLKEIFP